VARHRIFRWYGKAARDKIAQALAAVGLNGFENRSIGTLSGGQMQRMLLHVCCCRPRLIVLDEPSTPSTQKPRPTAGAGQALARRSAPCWRRCTTWIWCARIFRRRCCWPAGRGVGRTAQVLTGRESRRGAADVRGVRRHGCGLRRARRAVAGGLTSMIFDALIAPFTEFESCAARWPP